MSREINANNSAINHWHLKNKPNFKALFFVKANANYQYFNVAFYFDNCR
jgi:hypothetical protein